MRPRGAASTSPTNRVVIVIALVGVVAVLSVIAIIAATIAITRQVDDGDDEVVTQASIGIDPAMSRVHKAIFEMERSSARARGEEKVVLKAQADTFRAIMNQAAAYEQARRTFNNAGAASAETMPDRNSLSDRRTMLATMEKEGEALSAMLRQVPSMYDSQLRACGVSASAHATAMGKFHSGSPHFYMQNLLDDELTLMALYDERLQILFDYFDSVSIEEGHVWIRSDRARERFRKNEKALLDAVAKVSASLNSFDMSLNNVN